MSEQTILQGQDGVELYSLPLLYDIAYDWDVTRELCFFLECMELFGRGPAKHVLEPACGTGRNLEELARMDVRLTGYDNCPEAVEFAAKRLRKRRLAKHVDLHIGDMRSFCLPLQADGAFNSINSFRYLTTDEDVLGHLRTTRKMLKPGAVYVLDLSYAMPPRQQPKVYEWDSERDGIVVEVRWLTREDHNSSLSHEVCELRVNEGGKERLITTHHTTRLWTIDAFEKLVTQAGFEIMAIYTGALEAINWRNTHIDGRMDNLYHVLRSID